MNVVKLIAVVLAVLFMFAVIADHYSYVDNSAQDRAYDKCVHNGNSSVNCFKLIYRD